MPKISVIMPVYNINEEWLKEAIESILCQTYTDFEFLIIDDGSTNNTLEILQEYKEKDNRIKIILGEHKGISNALNKGLMNAQGEYIARMDGDDISKPYRLERQLKYMEENDNITILGCECETFPKYKKMCYEKDVDIFNVIFGCPIAHRKEPSRSITS